MLGLKGVFVGLLAPVKPFSSRGVIGECLHCSVADCLFKPATDRRKIKLI